jgi:Prokaryotic dksA/traR C4-type zinc finger
VHLEIRLIAIELICGSCAWRTVCGRDDAIARLRSIGLLRRNPDAEDELIRTLMAESVGRLACPACKELRLSARALDSAWAPDDFEWQAAALCEVCRKAIPAERLEAIPETKRCLVCQEVAETDATADDAIEYCPHCGALVEVRLSRGAGITRYKRFCTGIPPCRL